MPRPTPTLARAARFFAFLLLAGSALALSAPLAARGQPAPKQPATQPAAGDAPELKLRWEVEVKNAPDVALPLFDGGGTLVVLSGRTKIEAASFNVRTGKPGPELPSLDFSTSRTILLERGKIAFQPGTSIEKSLVVWDTTNGNVSRMPFTPVSKGLQTVNVSPNGRYVSVAATRMLKGGGVAEGPFQVLDGKTGKTVVSMEGQNGTTHFTADSARILAVDATDRFRWFKLPSGLPDVEWKFEREASRTNANVLGMSADGKVILYSGQPPKKELGVYLLDGKTGEVLHSFPARTYHERTGFLSPDGASVALVRTDGFGTGHAVELLDRRGTLLAKLKIPARTAQVAVSWEARAVALYERETKKLWVYDLPGAAGIVTASVRPREAGSAANRSPVPGDAAVAKAEAGVRQILKDEYARKQPAEKKALAQKLVTLAAQTPDDPASRYVMLRDAQELAVGVTDPGLALQAIGDLARWYQVEASAQQLAAMEKILATTSNLPTVRSVLEFAAAASDAAAEADDFDEAVQFAQLAASAVRKGKLGQSATDEADSRLAQARKDRDVFAAIRPALDKLATAPDDPTANSTVGKYRCFVQNRWDDGLKHLAKGEDAALRAVAELDLKTPRTGVPEDTTVADAWHAYAPTAPADALFGVQARARYWYTRSIPGLTGLNKARAEGRLVFASGGVDYRPGLVCELSAKQPAVLLGTKARLDPVIDFSGGEFAAGTKQTDLTLKWTGALVPPRAGRYTLVAQTTDPVRVRVDGKVVIDTTGAGAAKREAPVALGERATPFVVEFFAPNTATHKIKLAWVVPGGSAEEPIPAEYLFHDKKAAAALGK
jgi:hypothetical protein